MKRLLLVLLCSFVIALSLTVLPTQAANGKTLQITLRDFKKDDMLFSGSADTLENLARPTIGANRKVDFSDPNNPTQPLSGWQSLTQSDAVTLYDLNALFNDAPGVNMASAVNISLIEDENGFFSLDTMNRSLFDENGFFHPIENKLWGNEGNTCNSQFTMELHARFVYQGSGEFTLKGTGDTWIFINDQLVLAHGGDMVSENAYFSLHRLVSDDVLDMERGQTYSFDLFHMERKASGSGFNLITNIGLFNLEYGKASSWAAPFLDDAGTMGIIPGSLKGEDMTAPISREEFAELAVKFYEALTGRTAQPSKANFTDCSNPEVLKAYALNITSGVGGGKFAPNALLTRQ